MFDNKTHSYLNRIISIFQAHISPIVRGKSKAYVEFGAKVGLSVVNEYSYVDHISWNAYNKSKDLSMQIELYKITDIDCCLFLCQEFKEVLEETSTIAGRNYKWMALCCI